MIKKRVWEILELSKDNDSTSKYFDYFISILIGLNVVAIILETEKSFYERYTAYFLYFEVFFSYFKLRNMWNVFYWI